MIILKLLLTIVLIVITSMVIVLSSILLAGKDDTEFWYMKLIIPIILCAIDVYLWLYPWYHFVMF